MGTLKELLKDREFPVRVKNERESNLDYLDIYYIYGDKAYGHDISGVPDYAHLNSSKEWCLVEYSKPRLLAWRRVASSIGNGGVILCTLDEFNEVYKSSYYERCPWLDEKREGEG